MISSQPPPPGDKDAIDALPLDLFGGEAPPAPQPAPEAALPPDAPSADLSADAAEENLRSWEEAGLGATPVAVSALPKRLRRIYDGVALAALWLVIALVWGGIELHGRIFWHLIVAGLIYFGMVRLSKGMLRERVHVAIDTLRGKLAR